jgi:hypothetical protein
MKREHDRKEMGDATCGADTKIIMHSTRRRRSSMQGASQFEKLLLQGSQIGRSVKLEVKGESMYSSGIIGSNLKGAKRMGRCYE